MGRRPKAAVEGTAPSTPAAPVRRRRRTNVDHAAQTQALVSSLLTTRGSRGATQAEALAVTQWARSIHTEAAELKALASRVRLAKGENVAERQIALGVNQHLLESVLSGALGIDVTEAGEVAFVAQG